MMQSFIIRLPDEDRRLLELEAKKEGSSVAAVARKAIRIYLEEKPKQKSGADVLLEWVFKKNKKYKSSFKDKDLSTNYKDYLYGSKSSKFGYLWKDKK